MAVPSFIFGGTTGETQDTLARKRKVAEALMVKAGGAPKNVGEGLSAIGNALLYRSLMKKVDSGEKSVADNAAMDFDAITGAFGGASAANPVQTGGNMPKVDKAGDTALTPSTFNGDVKSGIQSTAESLGIDPVDLATAISYETAGTFDPRKKGPVTQWGQHEGLIQFGEPQAKKYGVNWDDPVGSQLGADGAVAKYLKDAGVQPGMGMMDIYSAINAGRVGRYNASDANNGGAPGTVADKVNQQMAGHRAKALAMFSDAQPQEVASLDSSAGITTMPVDRGAMLADPSAIAPEDAARLAAMRGDTGGAVPYVGPGAKIDTPMPVYDTEGLRMPATGSQPQTAAAAIEAISPTQQQGSLSDEVASFEQTPAYAAQFPGQKVDPVAQALATPRAASPAALPVVQPAETAQRPQPNQQVAQALLGRDQSGVGIGGDVPGEGYFPAQPNQVSQAGPSMQQLMQAASNPNLNDGQRRVVDALLQRKMESEERASNPDVAIETELKRAQIAALGRKGEGYSVLSKAERQQLGIPDTDQRVYQRGADGKIDAVGGAGQTINVGNEVEARRAAAEQAGLKPEDPAYQGFILTGKLPRENEQTLTATDKKAILEADEMVQGAENVLPLLTRAIELNDEAYSGPTAGIRGTIMGAVGGEAGQATQELDNVVTGQALGQMKSIFGGNPTEGERAILLDIAGSSKLPAEVRKGIFDRAMAAVNRRLDFYKQRAQDMRGGSYFKPPGEADPAAKTPADKAQTNKRLKFNQATGELE